jgi:RNA polymerase sigma-70 factor (ECF subfamily)
MPSLEDLDVESIQARMRRLAYRLIGRQDVLDDVVQTAMEALIRAMDSYREEGPIEAYADRITANIARSWIRKHHRRNVLDGFITVRANWPALPAGPAEQAQGRERLRRLMEIIEDLLPAHRMAFVLYYIDQKPVPEIARIEQASESAVRSRILRARRRVFERARRDPVLAEWIAELGDEE